MSQFKEGLFVGYIKKKGARSFGGKKEYIQRRKYIEPTGMDELGSLISVSEGQPPAGSKVR